MPLLAVAFIACAASERISPPPEGRLNPVVVIDAATDTTWTMIGSFALVGCAIAAIDPMAKALRVLDTGSTQWRTVAGPGDGPGELRHPMAIAASRDSTLVAMDWVRRRLISYRLDGRLVADSPLRCGVWRHAKIGRIEVAPDGRILDFWMARPSAIVISKAVFDTIPLVSVLDAAGNPMPGGWGTPRAPAAPEATLLASVLQQGDLAVRGGTLLVLRSMEGVLEEYSLGTFARLPARTLPLRRYRDTPKPTQTVPSEVGREGFLTRGRVTAAPRALAFPDDSSGRLYVVSPLNDPVTPDHLWPSEALTVYDSMGAIIASFRLPGVNTRRAATAPDGSLIILGHPDVDVTWTPALQIYEPLYRQVGHEPCGWKRTFAHGTEGG